MKQKGLRKPFLKPVSRDAFAYGTSTWSFIAIYTFLCSTLLALNSGRFVTIIRLLAHGHSAHTVASATALYFTELFIAIASAAYVISPSTVPLHRVFHGPLRYRRFHVSHMRLDRLRRASTLHQQLSLLHLHSTCTQPGRSSSTPTLRCDYKSSSLCARPRLLGGSASAADSSHTGSSYVTLELSDTDADDASEVFEASEWIGTGRRWNNDIPLNVRRARNSARKVPLIVAEKLIPASSVDASTIIALYEGNSQSRTLTKPAYSDKCPNVLMDDPSSPEFLDALTTLHPLLFKSVVREHLSYLRTNFDEGWLAGSRSIVLPISPEHRWPLWTEKLLGELEIMCRKQDKWISADNWLRAMEELPGSDEQIDLVEACRERLTEIPWNATVPDLGDGVVLHTSHLATFLSDNWLDDEMINAGSAHILSELEEGSRISIADCFFLPSLHRTYTRHDGRYIFNSSSSVDHAIREGAVDILEVPVNPGSHWAGIRVDLRQKTFAYRDGSHPTATVSEEDSRLLSWYLNETLQHLSQWTIVDPLPSPIQDDSFSCGIVYLSTLAAEYVGYEPWSQNAYAVHRMEWFLRLSERLLPHGPEVSRSSLDGQSTRQTLTTVDSVDSMLVDSTSEPLPLISPSPPRTPSLIGATDAQRAIPLASGTKRSSAFISQSNDSDSESGYATDESRTASRSRPYKRRVISSSSGRQSKTTSWQYQRALRIEAQSSPTFKLDAQRLAVFRQKILNDDGHAEFKSNGCAVRCSACAEWITMRVLYDTKRWKDHRQSKKCQKRRSAGLVTRSIRSFFGPCPASTDEVAVDSATTSSPVHSAPPQTVPCTGLTRASNQLIDKYLRRSAVDGGGAPSRHKIARQLFKDYSSRECRWSQLNDREKMMVSRRERSLYQWHNRHALGAVFATTCTGHALPIPGRSDYAPCDSCRRLLTLHVFQNRLNVPLPEERNEKFVPKLYRSSELGDLYLKHRGVRDLIEADDGRSPWLKFAKGVIAGDFSSQDTMLAMVRAMVIKSERLRDGKSLRNMQYPEALDAFGNYLVSISPRAYRAFQKTFIGRSMRSIQYLRAKQPRFEPGITAGNVERAVTAIRDLGYYGPLVLSWDDTELEKALTVRQGSDGTWQILGAAQGPIFIKSTEDIDSKLEHTRVDQLADKLRIYLLLIPLPKIPPYLVAAEARGSKESADDLLARHRALIELLEPYGIYPVTNAADGTEVERLLQRKIVESADSFYPFSIANDITDCILTFTVPLFNGRPSIMVQDSKHGGKTARNQPMSGSRVMVIGNEPVHYKLIHNLSQHPKGPLFKRDVERVDKQDDRAAQRLLSAEALECNLQYFSDTGKGLSVYLFIMGEIYDAWQNRSIPHVERAKMVLRARFFLMAWRAHIVAHPEYRLHVHFISHESFDIFIRLCDSLIELMVVYRRFYADYPLLPWLHSTEVCEHIFGMLRQLKPDFNYSDMLHLEPKLRSLMLGAFQDLSHEEQATQTAAGYHHTYFHAPDLDLAALMEWPTDQGFADASNHAFKEAEQLLATVGISARDMITAHRGLGSSVLKSTSEIAAEHVEETLTSEMQSTRTLADLLTLYNGNSSLLTSRAEDEMETCVMALAAEDVDKSLSIMTLPEDRDSDDAAIQSLIRDYTEQAMAVRTTAAEPTPSSLSLMLTVLNESNAVLHDLEMSTPVLNADVLVSIRKKHQPKSTSKAVRQVFYRLKNPTELPANGAHQRVAGTEQESTLDDADSVRAELMSRLATLTRTGLLPAHNTTAGANRQVRHNGIYVIGNVPTSLRSQQKAALLLTSSTKFTANRTIAFAPLQRLHDAMHNANISPLYPLNPGNFIIALRPGLKDDAPRILLGEVITMYTNSGARGANHDWTLSITSVGAPSYISIRIFVRSHLHTYSSLSCVELGCVTILRIPRTHVLLSLATATSEIKKVNLTKDPNHPFHFLTLGSYPTRILKALEDHKYEVSASVQALVQLEAQRRRTTDSSVEMSGVDTTTAADLGA